MKTMKRPTTSTPARMRAALVTALLAAGALGLACGKSKPPAGGTATGGTAPAATGGATGMNTGGSAPTSTGGTAPTGAGGTAPTGTGGTVAPPTGDGAPTTEAANPPAPDAPAVNQPTVVLFLIDGLSPAAAKTAADNGATNLKMIFDSGVTVASALSTTPAARTTLPDGSLPWGNATSGNIAVHTGTHLFEADAKGLDDIFQSSRAAGIKSVFSGGDGNYAGLKTADFSYAESVADDLIVGRALDHLKKDKVRLLRLHLQRVRDFWKGPADKTNPSSAYVRHIVAADGLLGQLIAALKTEGVWDRTFLVVTADHGMGASASSSHPQSTRISWDIFMGFYGPGLKKGATIPYAELPDVAVTTMHFLGLPPLRGHTAASVTLARKGPTGTVLTNLFAGAPDEVAHPRYVEQFLKLNTFPDNMDNYAAYRSGMLMLIK